MGFSFKKFTRWTGNLITDPGKAIKDFSTGIHNASKDLNDWWNGLINPDVPEPITGVLLNRSASNAAIRVVYGSRRVGGQRVYLSTGGDKNKYVYIVLSLAEGPITAVRDIEINSKPLADFGSKARISIHLGTDDQAADADFVSELDDWTEAHKLSGIAYLACRFEYDSDLFSGIPTITGVVDGRALYDPRSDSTAFSQNHALVVLDYLRNSRYGVSVPDAEINFDAFKAAADICDEVSETAAASNVFVSRFACNYVLSTDKTRLDNIKTLVSACRGFLPYQNGQYALTIVNDDTVVFEFDERHIVGEVAIQPPSKRTRNNRITAKFVNPDRNWKEDEVSWPTDQALYEQFLEEDNGIELETSLTLDNVTSPYQALDIARQACLESRASLTVAFTATQEALAAYVGRVVSLSYGSLGFDQRLFRVESREISSEVTVQISLVEFDPTIYPWADMPEIDAVKPVALPDPLNLPAVTGLSFAPSDYNSVQCGVLSWDESQSAYVDRYRVEVVNKSSGVLVFAATVSDTSVQVPNVLAGEYQAIVRGVSALSRTPAATVDFSFSVPALDTPMNLHQVGSFDSALTLAWDGSNSDALARYQIKIITDVSTVLATFSSTEPRYVIELATFESLLFPRAFVVSVASVNVAGVVSDTASISVNKAAPSAPLSVTLWEGVNQAELIYSLPSNANGVSVWLDTDGQAQRTDANLVYRGNDLRTTLSGLTPETEYYVWIASYDAFGSGPVTSLAFNTLVDAVAQTLGALETITNQLGQDSQTSIDKIDALESITDQLAQTSQTSVDKIGVLSKQTKVLDTRLNRVNKLDAISADAILENVVKSAEIEQKTVTLEQSSAQLRYEQTLLVEADLALAQTITELDAEFEDNKATVGEELTALADADQTIAQSVTDLDAEFESNKTSVDQQLTTLAGADQTIAQSVTDLDAEFESNKSSVDQQLTVLANADQTIAQSVTDLDAEFESNKSSVDQQLTALANTDQTIAQSVTDLDAEFESNKSSVEQQLTTLANADQTIAQSVTDLDAEFESNKTSVEQQLTTLANADQTIAQSVTDLDAEFESNKTSVEQQLTTLANADQTIAQSVTDLDAEFESNKSSVEQQLTTLANADQTIAQSVTDLDAEFESNKSSVEQQFTTLANADQTIAQSVTDLDAEFESNKTSVEQQLTALADADQSTAEFQRSISAKHSNTKQSTNDELLETVVSNAELLTKNTELEQASARLSYEQTVLADEDQTIAQSVTDLDAEFESNKTSVEQQLTTLANADQTIAQSITDLDAEFENNKTSVEQQLTTLANADQTIAQSVTDLDAEFESNKTSVEQQLTTLANTDQTIAQSVTDLDAEFESNKTTVSQQLTALADEDQALAESIEGLSVQRDDDQASLDEYKRTAIGYCPTGDHKTAAECDAAGHTWVTSPLAEAMQRALIEIADDSGNVSTAQAGQLFQTLVNDTGDLQAAASLFAIVKNQLAGLFINVGQSGSDMQFLADKFTFKTTNGTKTPLQIVGETLELVNAVVRSSLNINDKALIDSDGTAYFEDGSFRGHVEATSGTFTGHVEATSGTFTGHVDATSGSFSGDIDAERIMDTQWQRPVTVSYIINTDLHQTDFSWTGSPTYISKYQEINIPKSSRSIQNSKTEIFDISIWVYVDFDYWPNWIEWDEPWPFPNDGWGQDTLQGGVYADEYNKRRWVKVPEKWYWINYHPSTSGTTRLWLNTFRVKAAMGNPPDTTPVKVVVSVPSKTSDSEGFRFYNGPYSNQY